MDLRIADQAFRVAMFRPRPLIVPKITLWFPPYSRFIMRSTLCCVLGAGQTFRSGVPLPTREHDSDSSVEESSLDCLIGHSKRNPGAAAGVRASTGKKRLCFLHRHPQAGARLATIFPQLTKKRVCALIFQ